MKQYLCWISLTCFLISSSYGNALNSSELREHRLYRVEWVIDGDTIKLDNGQHVRLLGIDAPENRDDAKLRKDIQRRRSTKSVELARGKKSRQYLKRMVEGKKVSLKFDKERFDQYHRTLAYVYLPNGKFINAQMIKEGYAYYYDDRRNVDIQHLELFKELYQEATEHHRGLWKNGGKNEKNLKWFSDN